jgi:hypothetical protein
MNTIPVYKYPVVYARENDELEQYRASYKANVACKNAIETAIRDNTAITSGKNRKTSCRPVWL